jgi:hypothetical protein
MIGVGNRKDVLLTSPDWRNQCESTPFRQRCFKSPEIGDEVIINQELKIWTRISGLWIKHVFIQFLMSCSKHLQEVDGGSALVDINNLFTHVDQFTGYCEILDSYFQFVSTAPGCKTILHVSCIVLGRLALASSIRVTVVE